jgi:hypothetical protein
MQISVVACQHNPDVLKINFSDPRASFESLIPYEFLPHLTGEVTGQEPIESHVGCRYSTRIAKVLPPHKVADHETYNIAKDAWDKMSEHDRDIEKLTNAGFKNRAKTIIL